MIVEPTARSEVIRRTALPFLVPLGWIAVSLSLFPLRRLAEPVLAIVLEVVLTRRQHRYEYLPEHFPWVITAFVAFGVGLLALMAWIARGAFMSERQLTRRLQDRVDETAIRNTRPLGDL